MKKIVIAILAGLLLSPGIVGAADKKTAQDPAGAGATKSLQVKLDLNRASVEELVGVPGIGPRMAQAIIDLRLTKGSFQTVEELLEVTGIKEKKFTAIARFFEVVPLQQSTPPPASQPK